MNVAETSRQINMTSYHSISGNNSFKSHLNAKSFNRFLRQQQQLCEARFPYFVLPHSTTCHHKFWINQTICQAKPTKFIIKLYTGLNTLWDKHAAHQKIESLRASSLSKLDSTSISSCISNTKYAEFTKKQLVLLYFHNPNCAYNHLYNLYQNSVPLLWSIFTALIHPYVFTTLSLQSPAMLPSSIPQQFCPFSFLGTTITTIITKNIFPTSATQPIQAAPRDQVVS